MEGGFCTKYAVLLAKNILTVTDQESLADRNDTPELLQCKRCNENIFTFPLRKEFVGLLCGHYIHRDCLESNKTCLDCHSASDRLFLSQNNHKTTDPSYVVAETGALKSVTSSCNNVEAAHEHGLGTSSVKDLPVVNKTEKKTEKSHTNTLQEIHKTINDKSAAVSYVKQQSVLNNRSNEQTPLSDREREFIQEISSSIGQQEGNCCPPVNEENSTETVPNTVCQKSVHDTVTLQHLAKLYRKATSAEISAMEANRKEILCWYYYASAFINNVKRFVTDERVGEKTAKGRIYDFIASQHPKIKRGNLCKKTQRAIKIYKLFEKIGIDKIKHVTTYSANLIASFTNNQIQSIIHYFSVEHNEKLAGNRDPPITENERNTVNFTSNPNQAINSCSSVEYDEGFQGIQDSATIEIAEQDTTSFTNSEIQDNLSVGHDEGSHEERDPSITETVEQDTFISQGNDSATDSIGSVIVSLKTDSSTDNISQSIVPQELHSSDLDDRTTTVSRNKEYENEYICEQANEHFHASSVYDPSYEKFLDTDNVIIEEFHRLDSTSNNICKETIIPNLSTRKPLTYDRDDNIDDDIDDDIDEELIDHIGREYTKIIRGELASWKLKGQNKHANASCFECRSYGALCPSCFVTDYNTKVRRKLVEIDIEDDEPGYETPNSDSMHNALSMNCSSISSF
ncbi:uncharacterized protein OCT59_002897 [Rhizophagus irregularis]|uniref:RING-type domain-containing protein n=1 Tax=Rhizophagus irregularis (strain DAOM 181602 / DAOM 197198 / MUCL 43194) TaxID=747089 RepID=U9UUV8_RHIID|nr:hypothetical protein GLOIN_2v1482501 [Rhizophagus irregularis DAOM 181602=DAOM 197198]POG66215.1 hypothetical protein GLOIN_2v1482501 [Rhizophagus irregularis DAOM 181602=DAOM 197198]UZO11326.1 hypothetical protein OCT59_002897 [Rhizophagus irregularis]GBC36616.1 hypothetical protein GLOIN_2v1482501 [Rhizophagus irregularis DAOM 181602=DAOM 197198]|eukprot:XP_025173081.1 hypothetical protein GLOIN_2v1482501 [Rhizophagus irregularis DAOM 181602=DAOM 197198]